MKQLVSIFCAAVCANAAYAVDAYRCEESVGYFAENILLKYDLSQFSESDTVLTLVIPEDWSWVLAARSEDDEIQYEYPKANTVAQSVDETGEMHSFYSFDAKKPLGHVFNITYRTDGMFGLKPKEQLGLKTISYDRTITTESFYLCKQLL